MYMHALCREKEVVLVKEQRAEVKRSRAKDHWRKAGRIHSDQRKLGGYLTVFNMKQHPGEVFSNSPFFFWLAEFWAVSKEFSLWNEATASRFPLPVQFRRRSAVWCASLWDRCVSLYKHHMSWSWGAGLQNAFLVRQQIVLPCLHFLGL